MKKVFPSWRYHKTESAKIIHSQEEHDELGDDWAMSPAHLEEPAEKPAKPEEKAEPVPEAGKGRGKQKPAKPEEKAV